MNHRPRRSPFEALLADPDLRALDAIAPAFDPLEVLATARKERPHTRFLAWLLDPHPVQPGASHGLGASVLDALVCRALSALDPLPGAPFVRASVPPSFVPASLRVLREQPLGDHARAPDLRCHGADARGRSGWCSSRTSSTPTRATGSSRPTSRGPGRSTPAQSAC
ncbi:MAG: PD-(D/E)XK nuclease family protein [Deltaproteobacteria bacterium]|nr:PD-(D/E)XK nuclease family protein [Deltaproteobacteria bacterium]